MCHLARTADSFGSLRYSRLTYKFASKTKDEISGGRNATWLAKTCLPGQPLDYWTATELVLDRYWTPETATGQVCTGHILGQFLKVVIYRV